MAKSFDQQAFVHLKSVMNDYEVVSYYHFDTICKKTYLGERNLRCRFCKKIFPEVTFKKEAHAIPQFMGNRYLISNYECDDCNNTFSESLENEMGNFTKIFHTTCGVRGSKKIPTYKTKLARFSFNGKDAVIEQFENSSTNGLLTDKTFSINLITDKFIPISAYKCLVKIALTLAPETEMSFFDKTLEWIRKDSKIDYESASKNYPMIFSQLKHTDNFPHMSAILLKKRNSQIHSIPTFLFRVTYSQLCFQVHIPLCELDNHANFTFSDIPYIPHYIDLLNGFDSSEKTIIDLSSNEKIYMKINLEINNLDL